MNCIELKNLYKSFSQKKVLQNVSLTFYAGNLHTLLGENGAGKTTIASMLCGLEFPDSGEIFIDGERKEFSNSREAYECGIAIVHQTPVLAKNLRVYQSIILGNEPKFFFTLIDRKKALREITSLENEWKIFLPLQKKVYELSASEVFYCALLAALYRKPKYLLLDEPTSSLDEKQRRILYECITKAKCNGLGIILITHNVKEAVKYSDTISILKKGNVSKQFQNKINKTTEEDLLQEIFGESHLPSIPKTEKQDLETKNISSYNILLELQNVTARPHNQAAIFDISFKVKEGNITSIIGQREAGLDTLEEILTGIKAISSSGKFFINEKHTRKINPRVIRKIGGAIIPYNRRMRASNPELTVSEILAVYNKSKCGNDNILANSIIENANINAKSNDKVKTLSGGMLQRLIFARETLRTPRLLIISEPFQAMDYNSSQMFAKKLRALADSGTAVLVLSTSAYHIGTYTDKLYSLAGGKLYEKEFVK